MIVARPYVPHSLHDESGKCGPRMGCLRFFPLTRAYHQETGHGPRRSAHVEQCPMARVFAEEQVAADPQRPRGFAASRERQR